MKISNYQCILFSVAKAMCVNAPGALVPPRVWMSYQCITHTLYRFLLDIEKFTTEFLCAFIAKTYKLVLCCNFH